MQLTTITQKGQVTIPVNIRKKWGLKSRQKIAFFEKEGRIEVKPAVDFFKLKGSIKTKKNYSDKLADRAVGKHLASQYARKIKTA